MLSLIELYGLAFAAMAALLIVFQLLQRVFWFARQRTGSLFLRYLVLPLVFPRTRFFGNITWGRLIPQFAYFSVNVVTNVIGTRSLEEAGTRAANLSITNLALLLASQPALMADLLGLSLRTYLQVHGTIAIATIMQALTHILILLQAHKISIRAGKQFYGFLVSPPILNSVTGSKLPRLPLP
jgi:sorbitol-specific phosphotransferase system component IIC